MQRCTAAAGFTLVEVLLASVLLMTVWLATARLFAVSASANATARALTQATIMAVEKIEQLRALPLDDPALAPSPPGTLAADVEGYYDAPQPRYVRRWAIAPVPSFPDAATSILVAVTPAAGGGAVRLVTIRSRKAE